MQGTKQEPQALREFSSSTPEATTNLILYDWLSFTSKKHTPRQLVHALGLDDVPCETVKGSRGYKDRMYFSCISIHYNGRADMGVWVELTGQGCRTFESLSTLSNVWQARQRGQSRARSTLPPQVKNTTARAADT